MERRPSIVTATAETCGHLSTLITVPLRDGNMDRQRAKLGELLSELPTEEVRGFKGALHLAFDRTGPSAYFPGEEPGRVDQIGFPIDVLGRTSPHKR